MTMRPCSIARVELWLSSVEENLQVAAENYTCEPKCFVFISTHVRLQLSGQGLTQHEK